MPLLLIGYKSAAVLSMISPIHFVLHSQDYGGTGGFVQGDQKGWPRFDLWGPKILCHF